MENFIDDIKLFFSQNLQHRYFVVFLFHGVTDKIVSKVSFKIIENDNTKKLRTKYGHIWVLLGWHTGHRDAS